MTTAENTTPSKKIPSGQRAVGSPKKNTREIILSAAIKVFSDYPYYAASIRMIGKAAGIEHPLINYYFPTKAALFEEVLETVTADYYQANISWFEGLAGLGPETALSLYLDRFLDFALNHPKPLRIIALNLVQAEGPEIIPGYQRIQSLFTKMTRTFINAAPLNAPTNNVEMLTASFNTLAINYLGASTYYSGILGLEPQSTEYLQWVKDSLTFMILPRLKQLLVGQTEA
ncbi:MAG: TetR/AcrR family transcriptional regulator [Desulfosalsimonadaceae bacterium]